MKHFFWLIFLALPAWAGETMPDFAWQAPIHIETGVPYQRLTLPLAVYEASASHNLADLRVFNAAEQAVPLARVPQTSREEHTLRNVALHWFPLTASTTAGSTGLKVQVRQNNDGTLVAIESAPAQETSRQGYILDASRIQHRQQIQALTLDWKDSTGFQLLDLESSDDLQTWQSVRRGIQLAKLAYQGEHIEQRRIELNGLTGRYLRLHWRTPAQAPELSSAELEESTRHWLNPATAWTSPLATPATPFKLQEGEYYYRLAQRLPLSRLRIALPEGNSLLPIEILQPNTDRRRWRTLAQGMVYRITDQGHAWQQDEITLPGTPVDELILRLQRPASQARAPQITGGMEPEQVIFLTEGQAPYTLAIGLPQALSQNWPLTRLIPDLDRSAHIGEALLNQQPALIHMQKPLPVRSQASWKKYLLWAVLVIGVLAMAAMAWQLLRQMSHRPAKDL